MTQNPPQTSPHAAFAVCRCTHTQRRHMDLAGPCEAAACGCGEFRTGASPNDDAVENTPMAAVLPIQSPVVRAAAVAPALPGTITVRKETTTGLPGSATVVVDGVRRPAPPANVGGNVLEAARNSAKASTRQLGLRIEAMLTQLRTVVRDEQEEAARSRADQERREAARRRLEAIEKEAAELRQVLGTRKPRKPKPNAEPSAPAGEIKGEVVDGLGRSLAAGDYPCPLGECDMRFDSRQALAVHQSRARIHNEAKS